MKLRIALALTILLAGCAGDPVRPVSDSLFDDSLFSPASQPVGAGQVFVLDAPIKRFLAADIAPQLRAKGTQQGLYDSLYGKGKLKLDYDATMTRNASQAFAARSGNCLSLVILTAAIAHELGLPVRFQLVYTDEAWSRSETLDFFDEHVNLTLGKTEAIGRRGQIDGQEMTVDFLPPKNLEGLRTRVIDEKTIVAMYMNNRSAESLSQHQVDNAYWWARAAVMTDPRYLPGYNTLGVVYKAHGNPVQAERVFRRILDAEPDNAMAMSNLVPVLAALGRVGEAQRLGEALKKIRPYPPFHFFDLGMQAMQSGDFARARGLFAQEIQRNAYYDQAHFWLSLAYYKLDDLKNARKEMDVAIQTSSSTGGQQLYSAKLAWLKAAHPR